MKHTKNCVFIQSESYYLKTAFKGSLEKIKILNPVINFSKGYESSKDDFINLAVELGQTEKNHPKLSILHSKNSN